MPSGQPSSAQARRGWRGASGAASPTSRWVARGVLTLVALGLIGVFLYVVSRSRPPSRTYLFQQVAAYESTREDVPPGSYFFPKSIDQQDFDELQSGLIYQNQGPGDAIHAAAEGRPVIVCVAGQVIASPGSKSCRLLNPVAEEDVDLGQLLHDVGRLPAPLKLVVLELGTLAADPAQHVALNEASARLADIVQNEQAPGLWVLLSHGTGQVSWMAPLRKQSAFCEAFVLGLRGAADQPSQGGNDDQRVDLPELASYVVSRTYAWSQAHAPAVQTPLLLQAGAAKPIEPSALLADAALREWTLARVEPAASDKAPPPAPAKTTWLSPAGSPWLALAQAPAPAPSDAQTAKPADAKPDEPKPVESAASGKTEAAPAPAAAPGPPPKPPQTIDEYFAELWKLRDQLDAAQTLGDSPLDYGPLQWRLFQESLADRQLRYRLGRLDDATLLSELKQFHADLLALAPGASATPSAPSPPQGERVAEALAALRATRREQAAAWAQYRAQSVAPPEYSTALRRLQRVLARLPSYRAIAATTMTNAARCQAISQLETAVEGALRLLDAPRIDAAGVERFVQAAAAIDDAALGAELLAAAQAGPLMTTETLLATPLPSADERAKLIALAAKLSDPKGHAEFSPRVAPPALLTPTRAEWAAFDAWRDVMAGSARLMALGTTLATPDVDAPLGWQAWGELDRQLADAAKQLRASYATTGAPASKLRYGQAFLIEPRDRDAPFETAPSTLGAPPWPVYDAGAIQLALSSNVDAVVLPARFDGPSKEVEFVVRLRCANAKPRSLQFTMTYPSQRVKLEWRGPRDDLEREGLVSGRSYPLTPADLVELKLWASAAENRLPENLELKIVARAGGDGAAPEAKLDLPVRQGPPEVQIVAQGQPPPTGLEPLVLDCFPGANSIALEVVSQTSRRLSGLTVKLLLRDRGAAASGEPLATASLAELSSTPARAPLMLTAPPPPMGSDGKPTGVTLTGRELVCEVWEPAPAAPSAPMPPATTPQPILLLSRVIEFNALTPWDYLQPTFTWSADGRELQVRFVAHAGRLPAAGSVVRWNADHSTLKPEGGQLEATVRMDERGSLVARLPRTEVVEPESYRVVLDVDDYARGLVYDVPADPGRDAESLSQAEIRLLPTLLAPAGATPDEEKAFQAATAKLQLIDAERQRIVLRPDQRLSLTAEVNLPSSTFAAEQRDAIAVGFDENYDGQLDSREIQANFGDVRDMRLVWQGVDPKTGALLVSALAGDWTTELARIPPKPPRPVALVGEVRLQGEQETIRDSWQVVVDHQPPAVTEVGRIQPRQGEKSEITVTVEDPEPGSGVATVEVAPWRTGMTEAKWIAAQLDDGSTNRWTAPIDTAGLRLNDYDLMVRATDVVGNVADRPFRAERAVRVLAPLPPETVMKSKNNRVIVTLTVGGKAPRSAEVRLMKDGKPAAPTGQADAQGQCVFEDVEPGPYTVEASGRGMGSGRYDLASPVAVVVKEAPAPPAKVAGSLSKFVP